MKVHRLVHQQRVEAPLDEVFAFFSLARNLEEITPPWLRFETLTSEPIEMRAGTLIDYRLRLHGIPLRWSSRIELWEPEVAFVDVQVRGPYRLWHHRHEFDPVGGATIVRDIVDYALPLGGLGEVTYPFVRRDLRRIFSYRGARVRRLLDAHWQPGRPIPQLRLAH